MRKHRWLLIILISLILIQSYCISVASSTDAGPSTDDWGSFHHDSNHSGYTAIDIPTNSAKLLWTFETWKAVRSSPALTNGYLFIGSRDWHIYCLNASNGKQMWNYSTANEVNSSPAVYNGSVYVGSDDGYVYSIDLATGLPLWKSAIGGLVRSSPAIVEGRVYMGSGDHDVFCLNASDGATIWRYPTSNRVLSSPAVSDGVVYVATDDFFVYALNASTGNEVWRCHTGSVVSSPCVYNGFVHIGSTDGYVCALNASTGNMIWQYQTEGSVSSSPAAAYGCVYVGSDDNNVYCLNASDGKRVWQSPTGFWVRSSPAVADGNVYLGSEDFSIYCFDAFTGAKKWSYATGSSLSSSPAIVNGKLYVGSSDFGIYAFGLGDSPPETSLSQPTNFLPWTTVVFDAIVLAVATAIVLTIVRYVRSTKPERLNSELVNKSGRKTLFALAKLSSHTDTVCILVILAFSTIFYVNLGSGPLWVADEQTYSEWAFHMVKTGDYLTPWAFGQLEIGIGKPPLFIWLMSFAYQIFGVNNFASRFWSPVFATLSLVLVFYLGKNLYNSYVGFLSALVLGTFTTFYVFARHAMTDVVFVFFILASVYFLLLSERPGGSNRRVALGGFFFGLAFMTKQLQALLIPLIVFSYFIATRRGIRFFFTKRFALFWRVGLLIVSPWLIYMTLRFGPDFWQSHFIFSGVERVISPIEGHFGDYFFYFSYLVSNENPLWLALLPFAVGLCVLNMVAKRSKEEALVFVWMSVVIVVFTLVQTKLFWYILPALPAFAIAIGSFLFQLLKKIRASIRFLVLNINRTIGRFPQYRPCHGEHSTAQKNRNVASLSLNGIVLRLL
jgi:eukaryotic-like serine/threonine-protein kinase